MAVNVKLNKKLNDSRQIVVRNIIQINQMHSQWQLLSIQCMNNDCGQD